MSMSHTAHDPNVVKMTIEGDKIYVWFTDYNDCTKQQLYIIALATIKHQSNNSNEYTRYFGIGEKKHVIGAR